MFTYTSLARDQDFVAAILLAEQELEDLPLRTYPAVDVFSHGSDDAAQQQGNSPYTSTPDLREGHIRLLKLGADVTTGNIHCTTRIFPLHGRPSYTALSYAWGPLRASESRCKILLDGRERLLHKNLWDFLRRASQRRPGWLWIDALSIEQRCAEERSHQVGIMSDIFSNAKRVVIWLGRAYNVSDEAMKALSKPAYPQQNSGSKVAATKAINAIFNRPYWTRVWVFQEVKSAKTLTVMCGNALLSWTLLQNHVYGLYLDSEGQKLSTTPAVRMVFLRTSVIGISLYHILKATSHLHCTDPRDRVYALLSVASQGHEEIRADYTIQVADLVCSVLDGMSSISPSQSWEEEISRCLEILRIFRADSESLRKFESELKEDMDDIVEHTGTQTIANFRGRIQWFLVSKFHHGSFL